MAIENLQRANPVSIIRPTTVGRGKMFKVAILRRLDKAILNFVFANYKAILLIF